MALWDVYNISSGRSKDARHALHAGRDASSVKPVACPLGMFQGDSGVARRSTKFRISETN